MRRILCAALLAVAFCGPAHAVDVSNLSDFENDPCVLALSDRNAAQHVDAPDSALADACERAHGNIEVGWDFVLRTWKPPDVSALARPGVSPNGTSMALGLAGMLLVYAVLGWPVRALVTLLGLATARRPNLVAESVLAVVGRLVIGTVLLAALTVPFARPVAALAVLWSAIAALRRRPNRPAAATAETPASPLAVALAGGINDWAATLAGVLGLALFAQGSWAMLALGVLLVVVVSLPPVVAAWRRTRAHRAAIISAGVVLGALTGFMLVNDPKLVGAFPAAGVIVPLMCALAVTWGGGGVAWLRARTVGAEPRQTPPQVPGP
jgi:hypothetical protein